MQLSLQQHLESSLIPFSSCAGQWSWTVMEKCDHNWAKQCHQDVFLGVTSPMTLMTPMAPLTALHYWLFWYWVMCEQCPQAWKKRWSGRTRIWQRLGLKWAKVINSEILILLMWFSSSFFSRQLLSSILHNTSKKGRGSLLLKLPLNSVVWVQCLATCSEVKSTCISWQIQILVTQMFSELSEL